MNTTLYPIHFDSSFFFLHREELNELNEVRKSHWNSPFLNFSSGKYMTSTVLELNLLLNNYFLAFSASSMTENCTKTLPWPGVEAGSPNIGGLGAITFLHSPYLSISSLTSNSRSL